MILDFCKHKAKQEYKKAVIYNTLVKYFKDLQDASATNIPYFMEANTFYKKIIKSNKDVNYYFNKIVERV